MIVQTAAEGHPHFVIAMHQHTAFAGSVSAHFGNKDFAPIAPREPVQYVVDHHDHGWAELDALAPQSPETGLPYHLTATPLEQIVSTSAGSPAFNEAHHPFSGLISSMHTTGLYNGRFGMSDKVFLKLIPDELRSTVDAMLEVEAERQQRLTSQLEQSMPEYATEDAIFTAYKQLQFFDTFSLYMHCAHPGDRGQACFDHVPASNGSDVTITVTELAETVGDATPTYTVAPWPFEAETLDLSTAGRYLLPQPAETDLAQILDDTTVVHQTVHVVPG